MALSTPASATNRRGRTIAVGSRWAIRHRGVRRFGRSRSAVVGLAIVVALAVLALAAPLVAPHDPLATAPGEQFRSPSLDFPFGTDEFGRDLFSRTVYGGRTSLATAALAVAL